MRSIAKLTKAILAVSLLFVWTHRLAGQSRSAAEVRGTVTDQSGAVVPDVKVTITNVSTGVSQQVTTNGDGVYDAPWVPTGEYSVSFERQGFDKLTKTGITLQLETFTLDAALKVGSASYTVAVTVGAPLIQTDTAEGSTTITAQQLVDIPNVNRTWDNLIGLVPGVNGAGNQNATGQGAGINGMGGNQSNWQIDGGIALSPNGQNSILPPLDAIDEIKLTTSNFGAEYGNGLSVFNVNIKSGTNAWHGTLFEFNQNDFFNAKNYFNVGQKAEWRWNEFGGTLGGPIKRDKAFFFFSFQDNPSNTASPSFFTMPTDAMRQGDFSLASNPLGPGVSNGLQTIVDPATGVPFPGNKIPSVLIDSVGQKIMSYYPEPNLGQFIGANYYYAAPSPNTQRWINGKVDFRLNAANTVSASIFYDYTNTFFNDPICDIDCTNLIYKNYQGQLTDVWMISPTLSGEFRFSVFHAGGQVTPRTFGKGYPAQLGLVNGASDLFPSVSVEGTIGQGIGQGLPLASDVESDFGPAATMTWLKGKHVLKFGGEFDRWWTNGGWPMANEGNFDFNGLFSSGGVPGQGEGFADLLLGLPDNWSVNYVPETGGRLWSGQAFVQDEYKIRSNLTLTGGVRWIAQSGWSEVDGRTVNFDPTLMNPATGTLGAVVYGKPYQDRIWDFFAPRVGFSWSPRSNWAVRGGYGLYNMTFGGNNFNANFGTGFGPVGAESAVTASAPIFTLCSQCSNGSLYGGIPQGPPAPYYPTSADRGPASLNGNPITYFLPHTPIPYTEQYQLSVQHLLKGGVLVEVAFVGNHGVHLPYWRDMNQVPEALLGTGERPYPQFQTINAYENEDYSHYNSLQTSVRRNFANGLQFLVNYTWSHALDTMTVNGANQLSGSWQNSNDLRAEYGNSSTDQRHMFNGNLVYELPIGQGKRFLSRGGVSNAVLGGWQIGAMFQAHTGIPFTPYMASSYLEGALGSGTWRPNRIGSGSSRIRPFWSGLIHRRLCSPPRTHSATRGGIFCTVRALRMWTLA